ncbi:MAG: hypothetical protein ACXWP4_08015 [Polyangiales bacterium]
MPPPSDVMAPKVHYADEVALAMKMKKQKQARSKHLAACPFCRELFVDGESDTCPECGIELRDLADLPPSPEAEVLNHEEAAARPLQVTIPQAEMLPWTDMSRGRGILLLCALAGMAVFFLLPWAIQTSPENVIYKGHELAKRQGFFWMSLTAWLVLFPSVASRRTILKMVGSKIAVLMLAAMPAIWCGFLLTRPTRVIVKGLPFEYHWGPGFWATLTISVVATVVAFRFGGRLDDVTVRSGSSAGEVLH